MVGGGRGQQRLGAQEAGERVPRRQHLTGLEELHLGRNKITRVEGLGTLLALRVLGLASNRLRSLDGVQSLTALRELYADHNGIEAMSELAPLAQATSPGPRITDATPLPPRCASTHPGHRSYTRSSSAATACAQSSARR